MGELNHECGVAAVFHRQIAGGPVSRLLPIQGEGYVFQIEVTYRAIQAGFTVREVPIVFSDRRAGDSKMSWRIAIEAFWLVPQMRRSRQVSLTRS